MSTAESDYNTAMDLFQQEKFQEALEKFLQAAPGFKSANNKEQLLNTYAHIAIIFNDVGDYLQAKDYNLKRLELCRELGDKAGEAWALGGLSVIYSNLCDFQNAKDCQLKQLEMCKQLDDQEGQVDALDGLGYIFVNLSEYQNALTYSIEQLDLARKLGDQTNQVNSLVRLATVSLRVGQCQKADEFLKQGMLMADGLESKDVLIRLKILSAEIELWKGNCCAAYDFVNEAIKNIQESNFLFLETLALCLQGKIVVEMDKSATRAIEILSNTCETSAKRGEVQTKCIAMGYLAEAYLKNSDLARAESSSRESVSIAKDIGIISVESRSRATLARTLTALEKYTEAETEALLSIQQCQQIEEWFQEAESNLILGDIYRAICNVEKADAAYNAALELANRMGNQTLRFEAEKKLDVMAAMKKLSAEHIHRFEEYKKEMNIAEKEQMIADLTTKNESLTESLQKTTTELKELEKKSSNEIAELQTSSAEQQKRIKYLQSELAQRDRMSSGTEKPLLTWLDLEIDTEVAVTDRKQIVIENTIPGSSGVIPNGRNFDTYEARYQENPVCLQVFKNQSLPEADITVWNAWRREFEIMIKLANPNILRIVGFNSHAPNIAVVTEFMKHGDLLTLLLNRTKDIAWNTKLNMLRQIAKAMIMLQTQEIPIIHKDFKTSTVLVDEHFNVALSDLGIAKDAAQIGTVATPILSNSIVTIAYSAPEILRNEVPSISSNIFSFGIIMWEMMSRRRAYERMTDITVKESVLAGERLEIPVWFEREAQFNPSKKAYIDLLSECWAQNENERPESFSAVLDRLNAL